MQMSFEFYRRFQETFGPSVIGLWPLWEPAYSTILTNLANTGNGTYKNNPALNQSGIGDGKTSALFNGTSQVGLIHTARLQNVINWAQGTLLIWARITPGSWADGTNRVLAHIGIDATNFVRIMKSTVANQIQWSHRVGAANITISKSDIVTNDWFRIGLTWNSTLNRLRAYIQGMQYSTDLGGIGLLSGALAAGYTTLGAQTSTPALPWAGWLQYGALLNKEATATEMLQDYRYCPF
jgi:hypothetical protein